MAHDTVGQMADAGKKIRWECLAFPGQHSGPVDLQRIIDAKGEGFTLANRRPRCAVPDCPSRVRFVDRSSLYHRFLDTIAEGSEAWWSFNDAERAKLISRGWRCKMGKWVRPETKKGPAA